MLTVLTGRRIAIWGGGVEGEACAAALPPGTTFAFLADNIDDKRTNQVATRFGVEIIAVEDLDPRAFDVVVRSPGVSIHRPEIVAWRASGLDVTTLLDLWLRDPGVNHVVGVTGTKGKSTTSMLIAALLNAAGRQAEVGGNIGRPVLELSGLDIAVVEVSSYQASDVSVSPEFGVLTNLGVDHLSWHGSIETYHRDKLNLFAHAELRSLVVGELDADHRPLLGSVTAPIVWPEGRPYRSQGSVLFRGADVVIDLAGTQLAPVHLASNVAVAASVVEQVLGRSMTDDEITTVARSFRLPPGRMEVIPTTDGITWVNDALASNPLASAAGIASYTDRPIVLIVGGADRGVDIAPVLEALTAHGDVRAVVTLGDAGERWKAELLGFGMLATIEADDLAAAVAWIRGVAREGDVVLFAPAAPTDPAVGNWETRSAIFAAAVPRDRILDVEDLYDEWGLPH